MTLVETIEALKSAGLLERAAFIKAGDVEVQLGPPVLGDAPVMKPNRDDEMRALAEATYAASQGGIPGLG